MLLNNVVNHHSIGVNCCTTSITTILKSLSQSITITETEVFGLSSGLGFIYQYYKDEGYFISGRNESLEMNLAYTLGLTYDQGYSDDFNDSWTRNKEYLDQGIPVIVDLNVEYLPYFAGYVEDGFRFGLHNAILVGYDQENVYLLDHRWLDVKVVSFELYKQARTNDNSSIAPRNGWKVIIPNDATIHINEQHFYQSIETMYNRMKYPFAFKLGVEGIRMFFREVTLWSIQNADDISKQNFQTASFLLEKLGSGGGNFRRIYSRYLKLYSEKFQLPDSIMEVSIIYRQLAKEWKKLSELFEVLSTDRSLHWTEQLSELSNKIYIEEQRAIEILSYMLKEKEDATNKRNNQFITT